MSCIFRSVCLSLSLSIDICIYLEESLGLDFGRISVLAGRICVQQRCDATEHLQYERLSVHDVELFAYKLYGATEEAVGLVVGIDL